jgi:hypothetical protein
MGFDPIEEMLGSMQRHVGRLREHRQFLERMFAHLARPKDPLVEACFAYVDDKIESVEGTIEFVNERRRRPQ